MAGRTVIRAQLVEVVYERMGLTHTESAELVASVLAEISSALVRGEDVKISKFGKLFVRRRGQRLGRNPKTGEEVPISPRRVLVFHPSDALRTQVNNRARQAGRRKV
jgi:integration host factor subunit alpha